MKERGKIHRTVTGYVGCQVQRVESIHSSEVQLSVTSGVVEKRVQRMGRSGKVSVRHLLNSALAASALLSIGVFVSLNGPPHRWDKMILCDFTIPYQACASFAHPHPRSCQILLQTLIMLYHTS